MKGFFLYWMMVVSWILLLLIFRVLIVTYFYICYLIFSLHYFQRVAETLDFEIKRWAAGKEGNLRALLSTLQYVHILYTCTSDNL